MRRKYLQFSLSAFLIAVTCVAVVLGKFVNGAIRQAAAVRTIEQSQGVIQFVPIFPAPDWLRHSLGEESFRTVHSVDLSAHAGSNVSSELRHRALRYLKRLPDVAIVDLGNCDDIGDADLAQLQSLNALSSLYLNRSAVRGPGLAYLTQIPALRTISLLHTRLDDTGMEHLGNMPQLTAVHLSHTQVTDEGMAKLSRSSRMETLRLRNTNISDAGLEHLHTLRHLKYLDLAGTNVTLSGVTRFKHTLPQCRITTTFGLGVAANNELIFPPNHQPTSGELVDRLRQLRIDGHLNMGTDESSVRSLYLERCLCSDEVILALVKQLPQLEVLSIRYGLAGDKLLAELEGKEIRFLELRGTRITDDGLRHLARLPELTRLAIDETDITDRGLAHLHSVTTLRTVTLDDTRTTQKAVATLGAILKRNSAKDSFFSLGRPSGTARHGIFFETRSVEKKGHLTTYR